MFTTFPKSTETFLQREVAALLRAGVELRLYSLWGGGGMFNGTPVMTFNKWRLLQLFWVIPWIACTRWDVFGIVWRGLLTRRAPSWINFWENMLGAGFAALSYREFRREKPSHVHAVWSGAPATAAWCLGRMNGHRYSVGAHAYDIFEHGGDWWLLEKLREAVFIHTSTKMAKDELAARGISDTQVVDIRRGLVELPVFKTLRQQRRPLRIVCVARLVEKKGIDRQLELYALLRGRAFPFEARIVGDGPLGESLQTKADELGLSTQVRFTGHCDLAQVQEHYAWADVLVHTGVVAASGDRDGLPNVIPEAMAAGVLVVTTPTAGTTEAIQHKKTGLVVPLEEKERWCEALAALAEQDGLAESLRKEARRWVEENFDAHRNAAKLRALFQEVVCAR